MRTPLLFFGAALVANNVNAFFRMPCSQPVVVQRADSIVTPGKISGHLHTFMGGSSVDLTQTYQDTQASKCSSCKAKKDKSNYWTPTLFYKAQDGSFTPVKQNGGATIYYLQRRANDQEVLHPFPEGFKMLAGDPSLRSYDDNNLAQRAVSFVCLDYAGTGAGGEQHSIWNHNCPNGLRTQIFFPSCWDGVNLDSADHKSHVAYPDRMDSGICPKTHPVRLISIFYEIIWKTEEFADKWYNPNQHPFVLSNGDPTGYGFHGDFLNGWQTSALQTAIDKCTQNSGVIEDCSQFLELYTDDEMKDCAIPSRIDEPITGKLDSLPGCNPVQYGPGKAVASTCTKPAPSILSIDSVSFIKNDVPKWDGVGCARDSLNNRLLPKKFSSNDMTVEQCTTTCFNNGFKYAGLQYGVECWCGSTFDESRANLMGSCNMPCAGNPKEMCGAGQILSVYKYNPNKVISAQPPPPPPPPATTTSTSTTSSSTSTSTSTTSSSTTPKVQLPSTTTTTSSSQIPKPTPIVTPPVSPAPTGWYSRGCYKDPLNPRALTGTGMWYGVPMTPNACTDYCTKKGFSIAGTEYAGECFCGNRLSPGSVKVPDSECNMPCKGDSNAKCGGGARINIYTKDNRAIKRVDAFERHHRRAGHGLSRLSADY